MDISSGNETKEHNENNQIPTWISDLNKKRGKAIEISESRCCIYRVPPKLRVGGVDKFEPGVVSIGPYHTTKENLVVTENIKESFLQSLIARIAEDTAAENILIKIWEEISRLQADCHKCYSPTPALEEEAFVKMLIFDGCFLLELLYKYELDQLECCDILFQNDWIIPSLQHDLVLLENQIPLVVLKKLSELVPITKPETDTQPANASLPAKTRGHQEKHSLEQLILKFLDPILPTTDRTYSDYPITTDKHLLDLLRTYFIYKYVIPAQEEFGSNAFWEHTTCATDLQNAGVIFKKKETNQGLLDITFSSKVLEIPPFYLGRSWAVVFLNMIALEQCGNKEYLHKITSYAVLMDNLISSSADVRLLREKGIIAGSQQEDETIALIVSELCKEAICDKFYYDGVCSRLNAHRKKSWNQWRAAFVQNYIHTPWAGISLVSALVIMVISLGGTVFAVLQWKLASDEAGKTKNE